MQKQQFKRAYSAARTGGQINADTLEGIAAIVSLQDREKPDNIGLSFRFALDLSGLSERIARREEMQARRKARKNAVEYRFDFSILTQE